MAFSELFGTLGLSGTPAAVLWDLDGTLIDTEPTWNVATREVVEAHGGEWLPEDSEAIHGASSETHAGIMANALTRSKGEGADVPDPVDLFHEVVDAMARHVEDDLIVYPGAKQLMEEFASQGIPQALVTASPQRLVDVILPVLGESNFGAVVTGDEKVPSKPEPDPYLEAAKKLGVDAKDCLAFEDSPHGIKSATAAGVVVADVRRIDIGELVEQYLR